MFCAVLHSAVLKFTQMVTVSISGLQCSGTNITKSPGNMYKACRLYHYYLNVLDECYTIGTTAKSNKGDAVCKSLIEQTACATVCVLPETFCANQPLSASTSSYPVGTTNKQNKHPHIPPAPKTNRRSMPLGLMTRALVPGSSTFLTLFLLRWESHSLHL